MAELSHNLGNRKRRIDRLLCQIEASGHNTDVQQTRENTALACVVENQNGHSDSYCTNDRNGSDAAQFGRILRQRFEARLEAIP